VNREAVDRMQKLRDKNFVRTVVNLRLSDCQLPNCIELGKKLHFMHPLTACRLTLHIMLSPARES
jgi:hypothetical protein